jgi:steroid 5-alpha reductase family enzyme
VELSEEKIRLINTGKKPLGIYERGFTNQGLWKYMRHPNYIAEKAIWVCFYFMGEAITGE